ncbi:MAG: type VI secretion system baseplate subunit TssK [Gammaproteobacteria bacterium]|nr:type VI secretion system baseplate subunit TssK [Gammaproteobacteria bacterium]MBU1489816.1 type VI secretion system baseplate subunit TssK [Gammaproteobacteria bacterium]MBU2067735.1 type VI secretion system baseplate subunit TssK [Gammaproteobacteria bacterium]MBU2140918.1 type VI secretion system baseplate subunit TssK [Gammaproteobacteria bacterium]MBU2218410.1 type VI secretion system baseplate subunit TssK [Gammaproteobacteria bacterium]
MKVLPDAVCWHEGMQLLPQHFQLQGLRAEVLAAHFAQAGNPWFWGVNRCELDPAALSAGLVRIQALEAILPDGLPVSLLPGSGLSLELDVGPATAESPNACVTVYLAVNPLGRSGQVLPLSGRLTSVMGDAVPDLASGEHPEPVLVWRPNLRLVTDTGRVDSVCLPLLRIAKEGGGFVRQPYVAPSAQILPESVIGREVAGLCASAREKCLFLAGRLRQAEQAGNQDDMVEVRRQLAALWARLPEVEAALNSRVATPDRLHGALTGMAGAWCALDPGAGVPAFAPLDYLELKRGFDEVIDWLNMVLTRVRVGYRCLAFNPVEQGFCIQLPDSSARRQRLVIGLRMPAGTGEQAALSWLSQAIIASQAHLVTLARQRMSGLTQQPMSRSEQVTYSVGEETHLFVIQAAGEWFDPEQPLHIVMPGQTSHASPWQIVLFVANTQ